MTFISAKKKNFHGFAEYPTPAKMQTSALQRLGGQIQISGRLDSHIPTVEYVNRRGERVSPSTGRPYKTSDSSTNGLAKNKSKSGKRRRRPAVKRSGSMFGNLEVIPTDVTRDPPPRACFNCWQQGHSQHECSRPLTALYCNNCGRRGEDLRSCPRCSRAHNEYLLRLQARERGEEVESEEVLDESMFGAEREENDDACDEVLRELIYEDDRARELRRSNLSQDSQEVYTRHARVADFHDRRQTEQSSYRDREQSRQDEYIQSEYNSYNNYYDRQSDEEERDARLNSQEEDRECEDNYSHYDRESRAEYYKESRERKEGASYRGEEGERDYKARARRSENRNDGQDCRKGANTFEDVDLDADPVQEILKLAKSIAHLTPETQDLIMRQVMAERKERVRLRAMKLQKRREHVWP